MDRILMDHGSGGKLSHNLIKEVFLNTFESKTLKKLGDAALLELNGQSLAFTTDSYVIKPIFFPGGDIGKLSICGTVNDLCVMGATPLFISCSLIMEEGLEIDKLKKVINSMQEAASAAQVEIVTGDTKVVERGSGDEIYINTTGIGVINKEASLSKEKIEIGDKIILSGSIGDHAISILNERENLGLSSSLKSDCASLNNLVEGMLKISSNIKFMRDPTRGGLATSLNEVVEEQNFGIMLYEDKIPVKEEVRAACEILGFDPLYMANEGKLVAIVSSGDAPKVLQIMRSHYLGKESMIIGEIIDEPRGKVGLKTFIGGTRIVDMLTGSLLPRIC